MEQEEEDYFGEDDAAFELELQRMEVPDGELPLLQAVWWSF